MSQIATPYWVGNVTYLHILPRWQVGPDKLSYCYGYTPTQNPVAKVLILPVQEKKGNEPQS